MYSVGTADTRLARPTVRPGRYGTSVQVVEPSTLPVATTDPLQRRKERWKTVGKFALTMSGVLLPPWGVVLLIGWAISRSRPQNKASRLFKKALKVAATNPSAALPLLEEAHKHNPGDNDVLAAAGYVAHNAEDYTMAWRFLHELGRHTTLNPTELFILGHSFYETGQYDRAIEALQQIPETSDDYTRVTLLLGGCFSAKGDPTGALETLQKGPQHMVSLNDDLKELHYQLGLANEAKGYYEEAQHHFRQVYLADVNYRDIKERIEPGDRKLLTNGTAEASEADDAMPSGAAGRLRVLAGLRDEGLLTDEEYAQKKAELLEKL